MKRIKKTEIAVTFGSDASDDEFFIELRERKKDVFSFLSFATTKNGCIDVFIGRGEKSTILSINKFEDILANSVERLIGNKKIEKIKIALTSGYDSSDDDCHVELKKRRKDVFSFFSSASAKKSDIDIFFGKGKETTILSFTDFEDILANSIKRLNKAKKDWQQTLRENPDWQ